MITTMLRSGIAILLALVFPLFAAAEEVTVRPFLR